MKNCIMSYLSSIKRNRLYWLALLCIGIAFWIMNAYTPWITDDFNYHYMYEPVQVGDRISCIPVPAEADTWTKVFKSQFNHYQGVNGRFTTHCLVQFFCGILESKAWFNVANTLVFLLFLNIINSLCSQKKNLQLLLFSFSLTLLVLPMPGDTLLWRAGAMNYLWPTTFCLGLLHYCRPSTLAGSSWVKCIGLFFLGAFVGNMHEGITIGFAGGMFFYLLFNPKERNRGSLFLLAGLLIGAACIVLSPGSLHRVLVRDKLYEDAPFIISLLRNIVAVIYNTICHHWLILLVGLGITGTAIRNFSSFVRNPHMWICCCIYTLLLLIGSAAPDRAYFGLSTFCLILLLQWYNSFKVSAKKRGVIIALILCLYPTCKALVDIYDFHVYTKNKEYIINRSNKECYLNDKDLLVGNIDYEELHKSRYVMFNLHDQYRFERRRRAYAYYYGKEYIQILPPFLFEQQKKKDFLQGAQVMLSFCPNRGNDSLYYWQGEKYWVLPLNHILDRYSVSASVSFIMPKEKEEPLRSHQRFIRNLLQYNMGDKKEASAFNITKDGKDYWFFEGEPNAKRIDFFMNGEGKIITFVRKDKE